MKWEVNKKESISLFSAEARNTKYKYKYKTTIEDTFLPQNRSKVKGWKKKKWQRIYLYFSSSSS